MNPINRVPGATDIAQLSDDELVAFAADMKERISACDGQLNELPPDSHNVNGIRGAITHYERGRRIADEVLRVRHGGPLISFGPARPVHNFVTGYLTLKAVNRLMGLCEKLYDAAGAFIEEDDDEQWLNLKAAHETLTKALEAGGIE